MALTNSEVDVEVMIVQIDTCVGRYISAPIGMFWHDWLYVGKTVVELDGTARFGVASRSSHFVSHKIV